MTTTITVKALHGWPVRVEKLKPGTDEQLYPTEVVPAGETRDVYIHSGLDLRIHEIQPTEQGVPATVPHNGQLP